MRVSERSLSADERHALEVRRDSLRRGRGWSAAEARLWLPGYLLAAGAFSALSGVVAATVLHGGQARLIQWGLGGAGLGLVVGAVVWLYLWKSSARRDLRRQARLSGPEERRRVEAQLTRNSVQQFEGTVAAAAWWQDPEEPGAACVLDLGTDRLLLLVDLMEGTLSRRDLPRHYVALELLEETRDFLSVRFRGEPVVTTELALDHLPAPPQEDWSMMAMWFPGRLESWPRDLKRALDAEQVAERSVRER